MTATAPRPPRLPAWLTIPNGLTFVRILLTPVFGYFWWRRHFTLAVVVFVVASISDVLDGLLARLLDQRTRLGQILDPTADKLMVLVTFISAAATGAVPRWLAALVIGRDVLLASGGAFFAVFFRGVLGPDHWRPSRLGKYATFFTLCTIGLALIYQISHYPPFRPFIGALGAMSAVMTSVSALQYIAAGIQACRGGVKLPAGGDQQ